MVSVEYAGGSMGLTVCSLVMMVDEWPGHSSRVRATGCCVFFREQGDWAGFS